MTIWSKESDISYLVNADQHKPQVFTNFELANISLDEIPYVISMRSTGIAHLMVQWCEHNCASKWGWFFVHNKAFIGFADEQELIWFRLSNEFNT